MIMLKVFNQKKLVEIEGCRYNGSNNTPQAYFLTRSSTAQTEGLLISSDRKA